MNKAGKYLTGIAGLFAVSAALDFSVDYAQKQKNCIPDPDSHTRIAIVNYLGDFGGLIDPDGDGCIHGYIPTQE